MGNPHDALTPDQHRDLADLLAGWLPDRRWFAGKGNEITDTRICAVATLPWAPEVMHMILGVQLDRLRWHTYQVPLSLYEQPHPEARTIGQLASGQWVHDALTDPAAIRALLHPSGAQAQVDPDGTHQAAGSELAAASPQLQAVTDPGAYLDLPVRPLGGEQSNTSVVFGTTALAKFFRQLVPGVNPDVEVHAALAVARCPHVGQILGWVNSGWRNPVDGLWVTGHTAMVQALIAPAVEGRDLALERVAAGESFATEAHDLGRATGAVHRDMRQVLPSHALSQDEVRELVDRLTWRLDQVVADVPDLAEMAPALHDRIDAVRGLPGPIEVQRVHGDLHLQQVMRAEDGWKLLDFEGEPGSTVAARIAPDHALRDIAGMLRSFAYAAAQGGAKRPHDEVEQWLVESQRAFLAGYAEARAGEPDTPSGRAGAGAGSGHDVGSAAPGAGTPPGAAAASVAEDGSGGGATGSPGADPDDVILGAYLVDKAAYEAAYEQRNRPDWLPIPLAALRRLAGQPD